MSPRTRKIPAVVKTPESTPPANEPEGESTPESTPEETPESTPDAVTLDILRNAQDKNSGVEDANRALKLAPKVVDALEMLSRSLEEARKVRIALAALIMEVRQCFTFNGVSDDFGQGAAYRDGFARVVESIVAKRTGITHAQVRRDLDSVRTNVLNQERRRDLAIASRLKAEGKISADDWATWEKSLSDADDKPVKLTRENVPPAIRTGMAQVYRKAGQSVPDAYLTPKQAAKQKEEKESNGASTSGPGAGPTNPAETIGDLTDELIDVAGKHPYLFADSLWRAGTALSDLLIGAPGKPGLGEVPNRQRVMESLAALANLSAATVAVLAEKMPKEGVESLRFTEASAPDLLESLAAVMAENAAKNE